MLLGRCQNALESDDDQIINQVSANVLGAPSHEFLFEAGHAVCDRTLDFALGFHEAEHYGCSDNFVALRAEASDINGRSFELLGSHSES